MPYTPTPDTSAATQALTRLLELSSRDNIANGEERLHFSLQWLAAAKLVATSRVPGIWRIEDLLIPDSWHDLKNPGFDSKMPQWGRDAVPTPIQSAALTIVMQLVQEHGTSGWNLQDAVWQYLRINRISHEWPAFDPALCDLCVAALETHDRHVVWVPFDPSGQFTVRLARKGALVWQAGPVFKSRPLIELLLALEDDPTCRDRVAFDPEPVWAGLGAAAPTHCLVAAPMAVKMGGASYWRAWEQRAPRQFRVLHVSPAELDRSDAWAVALAWPSTTRRAVFVAPPFLMFAQGQEQRLRQALLTTFGRNQVAATVALPPNLLTHASIAISLLILDEAANPSTIRMVDLAGQTDDQGHLRYQFGRDVDVDYSLTLLAGPEVTQIAADVSVDECKLNDYSLMPSRYTRRVVDLAGNRRPLESLLRQLVRSPVPSKDFNAMPVWEIGIPLLDQWRPIEDGFERWMLLTGRKADEALLHPQDIVLSIKGTLGKAGIVGNLSTYLDGNTRWPTPGTPRIQDPGPATNAAVLSASCIALRVDATQIRPEYLLLFLRSGDFKRQLEALRVGSSIAHVTPSALLPSVLVPVPSLKEQDEIVVHYRQLCQLESQVDELKRKMQAVHADLFKN